MAGNSKRERILVKVVSNIEAIAAIEQTTRVQPNTLDDIRRYSSGQMPLVAVIGGVPQPTEHISGRKPGGVDVVLSKLGIDLYVYFMDNENPDSTLSSLMDDLWATLYADQTLGFKFVTGVIISPKVEIAAWPPYVAFSLVMNVNYHHTTGGI